MKTGRLALDEIEFIENNYRKMSIAEMARTLDRKPASIKNHVSKIKETGGSIDNQIVNLEYDIKSRPFWNEIKKQFSEEELPLLVYHWDKTIGQFKDDVLPTEELQIVDMIKMDVLMNRCLTDQHANGQLIKKLEKALEEASTDAVRSPELIQSLSTQIAIARQAQTNWSKDFQELANKKTGLMKELKATRLARVKDFANVRENFNSLLTTLLQDKDKRKEWGEYIEKMRIATEIELQRLSEYHQYADGVVDQPIFTPETAKEDNVLP